MPWRAPGTSSGDKHPGRHVEGTRGVNEASKRPRVTNDVAGGRSASRKGTRGGRSDRFEPENSDSEDSVSRDLYDMVTSAERKEPLPDLPRTPRRPAPLLPARNPPTPPSTLLKPRVPSQSELAFRRGQNGKRPPTPILPAPPARHEAPRARSTTEPRPTRPASVASRMYGHRKKKSWEYGAADGMALDIGVDGWEILLGANSHGCLKNEAGFSPKIFLAADISMTLASELVSLALHDIRQRDVLN